MGDLANDAEVARLAKKYANAAADRDAARLGVDEGALARAQEVKDAVKAGGTGKIRYYSHSQTDFFVLLRFNSKALFELLN